MGNGKKILIIEDEKNMRSAIKRILLQDLPSIEFIEAENGEQALKIVENNKPDLILLDVLMPQMNGLMVLKNLKESKNMEIRKIPVIILTAIGNRVIDSKARQLGAVDYITKPYNEKLLLMKIKKYLR